MNAAPDSVLGFANFLWMPFEYACNDIVFDSINTHGAESPCSLGNGALPFEGIIGSYKTCGVSGVAEGKINSALSDFFILPNPARNSIEILLMKDIGIFQYQLFNALGILQQKGITSEKSFMIDISDIPAGGYYLRLEANGIPVTKKVIIVK
jgi:hypothetical protein